MKRLLLLSNSTMPDDQFLGWPEAYIKSFFGEKRLKILFFPYAGVTFSFDEYFDKVSERFDAMGYEIIPAHRVESKEKALSEADAIAVGGGNTFQLADHLQKGWIEGIRKKVEEGAPYIGWSAGSNAACPTLKTTNDMPIVEPQSFKMLDLIPFQINPHYTESTIPNHGGETRPLRIKEFLVANPSMTVIGVPEGGLLQIEGGSMRYKGIGAVRVFQNGKEVETYTEDDDLDRWLK